MSADWPEVRLEDVTSKLGDGLHGTPKYNEDGEYYFINGNNLGDGKITIDAKTKRASKEEYLKYKKDLNDRTILVSINGTIGNIGLYNGEKVFLGKSACYFNVKEDVDKQFIRYVITSDYFQNHISSLASGSTIKNVSLKLMRDFTFRLPPLKIQSQISKILEDIDDKIELNRQTNQTLEQIAQAIFKSWFVDFEPVKAKIKAKKRWQALNQIIETSSPTCYAEEFETPDPNKTSLQEAMTQAAMAAISGKTEEQLKDLDEVTLQQLKITAALFPDALVESELGEIPEGWVHLKVKDITESVFSGGTPNTRSPEFWNGEYQWFSSGETKNKYVISTKKSITQEGIDGSSTKLARFGDILIASAGQGHTRGQTSFCASETYINQSVVAVRVDKEKCPPIWLFYNLKSRYAEMRMLSDSHSIRGSLTTKLLSGLDLIVSPNELLNAFAKIIDSLTEDEISNMQQNIVLSNARDALLPKLLSGELRLVG